MHADLKSVADTLADSIRNVSDAYGMEARESYLKSQGFKYLDAGAWKRVYASEKLVVKLFERGAYAFEVENAKTCPEHLKPLLVPILAHGPGFQIQRRMVMRKCPASCSGHLYGMDDSGGNGRNHTHAENGNVQIVDYGQRHQWSM